MDIHLEASKSIVVDVPGDLTNTIAYVYRGSLTVSNAFKEIKKGDVINFKIDPSKEINTIEFTGNSSEVSRLLFLAGKPLNEKKVKHGPFVVESREKVQKAIQDYKFGQNGFEGAHNWTSDLKKKMNSYGDL